MSSDEIMPFEEFEKKLKQKNINIDESYDIVTDNSLLAFFDMNCNFKFKFVKIENKKSKSMCSSNLTRYDPKNEELKNEKDKEFDSLYGSKENNSNTNIINVNNSQNSNTSNNNDKIAEMFIGKNLLCLIKNKLMMICSFKGKNENNDYYEIEANVLFRYKFLDKKIKEYEILEINKYNSLKKYIKEKSFKKKNKSSNDNNYMILINKEKFDSLDDDDDLISEDNLISNKKI